MEKILLKNKEDLYNTIKLFGKEWEKEINEEIKEYPCILVSLYADDIEFGEIYSFTTVTINDLKSNKLV